MKELSLNILDITENSVKAEATLTEILIDETKDSLTITIKDDGYGMSEETVKTVSNPFYTTRTTRKVGMGIPLFKMSAEQTGGNFKIVSREKKSNPDSHGTCVSASFNKGHIDYTPLGDIISTIVTLIQGHPNTDFRFVHNKMGNVIELDTRELRQVLEDVPLDSYDVIVWIKENLAEQYLSNQ